MEVIQHTDVLVTGAGAAGIAAAVAAARNGSKTVLIERNAFPGGKATAAEVGTVCGLYKFSRSENSEYISKGFAKEFAERLQQGSGTKPLFGNDGLHYLPYNIEVFKSLSLALLKENNVEVYFNASLDSIKTEKDVIGSAVVKISNDLVRFQLKSIIDCTGDSLISQAANLPLLKSEQYQAAAQVFTMKGIEEDNEARLGMIIMKALRSAIDEKKLEEHFDRVYIVQGSLKNNEAGFKIGIPVPVTHTSGNMEELQEAAHRFINTLTAYLINHVPVFKHASLHHIAPEVGVRVGFRTAGNYILTEEDVLGCRKFDDAIANASWPIEEWEQHKRVKMRYLKPGDHYQVPAGCLQSKGIKNLFMAGRNISATNAAIASARVMGTCLQTGYAAGSLASAAARGVAELAAINSIQNGQL